MRRIFGPKKEVEIGGWGKLRNEGLYNLHSAPHVRVMN
jgi:hypothetical protein